MMQTNAGIASMYLLKSISCTDAIIMRPTRNKAEAVAEPGMARKNGARKSETRKQMAVMNDVKPLRPPSFTPDALSTNVVTVLVPMTAPAVVLMASTRNACFRRGMRPFFIIPARAVTPMMVPMVSNKSTNNSVKTMMTMSNEKIFWNSSLQNMGSIEGGMLAMPLNSVTPIGMPMIVVAKIPKSSAPLIFLMSSTEVITMPMIPKRAGPSPMFPNETSVASLFTMIFAF